MMFDVVLLTFVIEIKCRAEFECCLRNQKETSSERMGFLFGYRDDTEIRWLVVK